MGMAALPKKPDDLYGILHRWHHWLSKVSLHSRVVTSFTEISVFTTSFHSPRVGMAATLVRIYRSQRNTLREFEASIKGPYVSTIDCQNRHCMPGFLGGYGYCITLHRLAP
jgi:hypothetical protein